MDSHADDVEALRRQMHAVRTSIVEDVHDLVENARSATDWRCYWRSHAWAWCGAAAALGYLIVPTRRIGHADVRRLAELAQSATAKPPPSASRRIMAELAGMAIGFVAQRGLQLLGDGIETLWASHKQRTDDSTPSGGESSPRQVNESRAPERTPGRKRRRDHE